MIESDHDVLIEMRTDIKYLVQKQAEFSNALYGKDGVCSRLNDVEHNQTRLIGAGNAVAAITSFLVAVGTIAVAIYTGVFS